MNLNNFRDYINGTIYNRGFAYYRQGRVKSLSALRDVGSFAAEVKGSRTYYVTFSLDADGEIGNLRCSCPYDMGPYCKHMAAALMVANDNKKTLLGTSSLDVKRLIGYYNQKAADAAETDVQSEDPVRLTAELDYNKNYDEIYFNLKIGRESKRSYLIKDIYALAMRFRNKDLHKYGKDLTYRHVLSALDDNSRKLYNLATAIYNASSNYYYDAKRNFELTNDWIDEFFELYRDSQILFQGDPYLVTYENPPVNLTIKMNDSGRYEAKMNKIFFFGGGRHGLFIDKKHRHIYLSETGFMNIIGSFCEVMTRNGSLVISSQDMPAFYSAVLKPITRFIDIDGLELLEEYAPPEAEIRIYIDAPDNSTVTAVLEFVYADKKYPAFYDTKKNPYCDFGAETTAVQLTKKYFDLKESFPDDPDAKFIAEGDDKLYTLLTEGLEKLSEQMDIYASDRFNRIAVRPPAHPVIGVRPESSLLAIDITAEGYTPEELVEGLKSYRAGRKYHRLRDGSFMAVEEGLAELAELTENLNISDKALIKANIKLPQYRMLYLNSLQNDPDGMRVSRSREFRQLIKKYNALIDDPRSRELPAEVEPVMREYQRAGFAWMKTVSEYGFGGILADDMGLGKTLQAISLMLDMKASKDGRAGFLVVCPASLMLNWESELRKFAPSLSSIIISGTVAERDGYIGEMDNYDVVITSYQTLARDISKYEDKSFDLHFIDEAQYIKNHGTQMAKAVKAVNSRIRFALTGTPVENSLAELWSIFDFIMPGYLHAYTYFKKTYERPIVKNNSDETVRALQRLTSPFILRRLKKEVLTELPDKTETVMRAKLDGEQSKVYSANVIETKSLIGASDDSGESKLRILAMLTRLRQVCCDPSLVYENYTGGSAKLDMCLELIESCINAGHKILLFSQFTSMLDIIAQNLREREIRFYTLTGKTKPKERLKLVNSFNADDTKVFLISLKAGGTGLNLTGADIVIHYDPWWNVSAENQASDRVYRIGQKRNVQIYKLIAEKTIEERIIEMQQRKEALADLALNGEGDIMKMSAGDILKLLE